MTATDNRTPVRSSTAQVQIRVQRDTHTPEFDAPLNIYRRQIPESIPVGVSDYFMTVAVTDNDLQVYFSCIRYLLRR